MKYNTCEHLIDAKKLLARPLFLPQNLKKCVLYCIFESNKSG